MIRTEKFSITTKGNSDMQNITQNVQELVKKNKIKNGLATIFIAGSTASITTIEFEEGLQRDFPKVLGKIAPENKKYHHNAAWQDGNAHSHIRASIVGPSLTVPFQNSKLLLGTWQQIVLIDFDTRPRKREIIVQIIGE